MIGPAFKEWALKPTPSHLWFDELLGDRKSEEVARLRERLSRYEEAFEIHVSGDIRHAAMCRDCKEFVCGTRYDLSVIERDLRSHVCGEPKEAMYRECQGVNDGDSKV